MDHPGFEGQKQQAKDRGHDASTPGPAEEHAETGIVPGPWTATQECYSATAVRHFLTPTNEGGFAREDGLGRGASPDFDDYLELSLRVDTSGTRIRKARFRAVGCPALVASASVITELVTGRTLTEAQSLTTAAVINALDGLPKNRAHCARLGVCALRSALKDCQRRRAAARSTPAVADGPERKKTP
jgi:nitrogen fixation NifU-like protein